MTADPVWHMGPLPGPGPALTTEEAAALATYDGYVHSMQMADIDGRVESEPNWAAPAWPAARVLRQDATAEAYEDASSWVAPEPEAEL
jgi:hypothetical protein